MNVFIAMPVPRVHVYLYIYIEIQYMRNEIAVVYLEGAGSYACIGMQRVQPKSIHRYEFNATANILLAENRKYCF